MDWPMLEMSDPVSRVATVAERRHKTINAIVVMAVAIAVIAHSRLLRVQHRTASDQADEQAAVALDVQVTHQLAVEVAQSPIDDGRAAGSLGGEDRDQRILAGHDAMAELAGEESVAGSDLAQREAAAVA